MGSGPAQLALAILAEILPTNEQALFLYQKFKSEKISILPRCWTITEDEILRWTKSQLRIDDMNSTHSENKLIEKYYTNSIGMEFVLIPAGSFMMGNNWSINYDESFDSLEGYDDDDDEIPQHQVIISKPFYLGKYEVTQAQWVAVMGDNPSRFSGRDNPVEQVSWNDVQKFIRRLNEKDGHGRYHLPTEAEWEYAARAGTTSVYSFGNDPVSLGRYAWYYGNAVKTTHPVGQKLPNPWGLYDMHGNVWEWVQDWYNWRYYADAPDSDPKGPPSGSFRVFRGGCCYYSAVDCRSAGRDFHLSVIRSIKFGFRLALSPDVAGKWGQARSDGMERAGGEKNILICQIESFDLKKASLDQLRKIVEIFDSS